MTTRFSVAYCQVITISAHFGFNIHEKAPARAGAFVFERPAVFRRG
jgi:hypothetical protein